VGLWVFVLFLYWAWVFSGIRHWSLGRVLGDGVRFLLLCSALFSVGFAFLEFLGVGLAICVFLYHEISLRHSIWSCKVPPPEFVDFCLKIM
jgi:hypothetical protein